jgi:hypothetical protein
MNELESLIVVAAATYAAKYFSGKHRKGSRLGKQTKQRERRTVEQIYQCLGDIYFRRAYRMSWRSFWTLHDKLCGPIERPEGEKNRRGVWVDRTI